MTKTKPAIRSAVPTKSELEQLAEFRYQLRRFLRFSEDATRRNGVTMTQYLLLLQIGGYPGRDWATISELADRLQAKHHGVVSLVSRCEALGWVTRSPHAADKRVIEVRLTAQGWRTVNRLAQLHRDELASVGDKFFVPVPDVSKS